MASITLDGTQENRADASTRPVIVWLFAVAALIFAMIIVGGATRLTDSGLSITEWQPLLGAIPPLSQADWMEAFDKYRQIPQYQLVNKGMSLEAFKVIYWWEWAHRFLGRIIGLAFFIPFAAFLITGHIRRAEAPKYLALFVLGGLQGALGWYMVQSGLTERVDVSQYRLAAHLGLAIIIYAAILWVAFGLIRPALRRDGVPTGIRHSATGFAAFVYVQIILGAFVAGTNAGWSHVTWPLMDGKFIPDGLAAMTPWYVNPFENVLTIQFNHRMMAYALVVWGLLHAFFVWRAGEVTGKVRVSAAIIGLLVLAQSAVGVWTLLAGVPVWLGLVHQGGAVLLLTAALYHRHVLTRTSH